MNIEKFVEAVWLDPLRTASNFCSGAYIKVSVARPPHGFSKVEYA
jgi:hypothetical protein